MSQSSRHQWLGYENPSPGRFVAVCSCGWRSPSFGNAGLAGSAADGHRATADEADPSEADESALDGAEPPATEG